MTTSRRELLCHAAGALTGLASIGCGLSTPAFSQAPQRRREVVVGGKRVRTVDLHAHCHVPEANALMGLKVQTPGLVVSPERIKAMDEQGIDIEALSLNPIFWYKAEPDLAKPGRQTAKREARRNLRGAARPVRRSGVGCLATPRTRRRAARRCGQKARIARRADRRQRQRRGAVGSQIPSVLGQGRRARRGDFHPPAGYRRTSRRRPAEGQRGAGECDRQPVGDDNRTLAPDF